MFANQKRKKNIKSFRFYNFETPKRIYSNQDRKISVNRPRNSKILEEWKFEISMESVNEFLQMKQSKSEEVMFN